MCRRFPTVTARSSPVLVGDSRFQDRLGEAPRRTEQAGRTTAEGSVPYRLPTGHPPQNSFSRKDSMLLSTSPDNPGAAPE